MSAPDPLYPRITLPTGEVASILTLEGEEAVSRPFCFDISFELPGDLQDPALWIGLETSLSIPQEKGHRPRVVYGLLAEARQLGVGAGGAPRYGARLISWFGALVHHIGSRVFNHGEGVEGILRRLFEGLGYVEGRDFEFRDLRGGQEPREVCIQYQESAFAFASRLMESEGIWYTFEHGEGDCRLVMGDSNRAFPQNPWAPEIALGQAPPADHPGHLRSLKVVSRLGPGAVTLGDFDFRSPGQALEARLKAGGAGEVHTHPGGFSGLSRGEALARIRMEAFLAQERVFEGEGDHPGLVSGTLFAIPGGGPGIAPGQDFLTLSLNHRFVGGGAGSPPYYHSDLKALPRDVTFRPPVTTPAPKALSTQSAKVVGPPGEPLWVDEHGRVRIQFHWDRYGGWDGESTCWVRVAQGWAGRGYGSIVLPRVGDEVVVGFLHGDPDRPIVTGSLYNGENHPPFSLPEHQGRHVFRSRSLQGTGGTEVFIDDDQGGGEVSLRSSGDLNIALDGGCRERIEGAMERDIGGGLAETIRGDVTLGLKGGDYGLECQGGDICLRAGLSSLTLKADGTIELKGVNIAIEGAGSIEAKALGNHRIRGGMVFIN